MFTGEPILPPERHPNPPVDTNASKPNSNTLSVRRRHMMSPPQFGQMTRLRIHHSRTELPLRVVRNFSAGFPPDQPAAGSLKPAVSGRSGGSDRFVL